MVAELPVSRRQASEELAAFIRLQPHQQCPHSHILALDDFVFDKLEDERLSTFRPTLFPRSHSGPDPFFKSTTWIPPHNSSFGALVSASGIRILALGLGVFTSGFGVLASFFAGNELCFEVLASSLIVCWGVWPSFLKVFSSIFFLSSPPASSSPLFSSSLKL